MIKRCVVGAALVVGAIAPAAHADECCYMFKRSGVHRIFSGDIFGRHFCEELGSQEREAVNQLLSPTQNAGSVGFSVNPRNISAVYNLMDCQNSRGGVIESPNIPTGSNPKSTIAVTNERETNTISPNEGTR